ncbi:MAG: hypothetical protein V4603_01125 [Pseudomonadota bacterium]
MSNNPSSVPAPSPRKLLQGMAAAIGAAALILVLIVLPAEYGIDYTGFGNALGLTSMAAAPTKTITMTDVIGGNEVIREVEIPEAGEPTPLPNPAVFQDDPAPPQTRTLQIVIPPNGETEVKVKMLAAKAIAFSWKTEKGLVYVDYHGHDPSFGPDFFVRYKEEQESTGGNGTLTAPFDGEHGWFWLNLEAEPVTITLTVTGYFVDLIDYGIF